MRAKPIARARKRRYITPGIAGEESGVDLIVTSHALHYVLFM